MICIKYVLRTDNNCVITDNVEMEKKVFFIITYYYYFYYLFYYIFYYYFVMCSIILLKDPLTVKPLFLIIFHVYNIIPAHLQSLG